MAATVAAIDAPASGAVAVNVSGGATASMREVIDLAGEVTGRPVPITAVDSQPATFP